MNKRIFAFVLALAMSAAITSCGSYTASSEKYITPEVQGNAVSISKSALSDEVVFVNYDADGTTVQLISVIASDGTYRLSLNTCQSCSPSPMAYFAEKDGRLVCQNCGNRFTADDVGVSSFGCNPMNIEYTDEDDSLVVSTSVLDKYASRFANWQGPTE